MTCVCAQHAHFIYHGADNARGCSDCNIGGERKDEKEIAWGKREGEFGKIEIVTARNHEAR